MSTVVRTYFIQLLKLHMVPQKDIENHIIMDAKKLCKHISSVLLTLPGVVENMINQSTTISTSILKQNRLDEVGIHTARSSTVQQLTDRSVLQRTGSCEY